MAINTDFFKTPGGQKLLLVVAAGVMCFLSQKYGVTFSAMLEKAMLVAGGGIAGGALMRSPGDVALVSVKPPSSPPAPPPPPISDGAL